MEEPTDEYVEEVNESGENIYDENPGVILIEVGEISPEEVAFMRGYEEASEYKKEEEKKPDEE